MSLAASQETSIGALDCIVVGGTIVQSRRHSPPQCRCNRRAELLFCSKYRGCFERDRSCDSVRSDFTIENTTVNVSSGRIRCIYARTFVRRYNEHPVKKYQTRMTVLVEPSWWSYRSKRSFIFLLDDLAILYLNLGMFSFLRGRLGWFKVGSVFCFIV